LKVPSRALGLALAGAAAAVAPQSGAQPVAELDPHEIRMIARHGPWPQPVLRDPSNRASGNPAAIALGQRLFFDPRLSSSGTIACASCHLPPKAWTDGRPRASGLAALDRNAPTVLDTGLNRWFGWSGAADSLWSFALKPLTDAREMGATPAQVARVLREDPALACAFDAAFATRVSAAKDDERVLVDVAKAIAAFVETVVSSPSPFDRFRQALVSSDREEAARYPAPALRGLKLFIGKGSCNACHFGPAFTNGEFHDVGIPFALGAGRVDAGRHEGIKQLKASPYNLLGAHSDDAGRASAAKTRYVEGTHVNFGQFKTPSLRNAALTAPYMHDGRFATLRDVVRHYSELDPERVHSHGEGGVLRPLRLTDGEIDDLVAFLESLTSPDATRMPPERPLPRGCEADQRPKARSARAP
jgi:cytochrome c peroxidase